MGALAAEYEVLAKVDKRPGLRRDGLFLGPLVDGQHLVVRFLDHATLEPLRVAMAYVPPGKLKLPIERKKDYFMHSAEIRSEGERLSWRSQVSPTHQIDVTGTYQPDHLVLDLRLLGPRGEVQTTENVRFEHMTNEEALAQKAPKFRELEPSIRQGRQLRTTSPTCSSAPPIAWLRGYIRLRPLESR